jgi:hypothetical protein
MLITDDDDDFVQLNFPQSELDKSDHGDGTAAGDDAQSNQSDLKIAALEVMANHCLQWTYSINILWHF